MTEPWVDDWLEAAYESAVTGDYDETHELDWDDEEDED